MLCQTFLIPIADCSYLLPIVHNYCQLFIPIANCSSYQLPIVHIYCRAGRGLRTLGSRCGRQPSNQNIEKKYDCQRSSTFEAECWKWWWLPKKVQPCSRNICLLKKFNLSDPVLAEHQHPQVHQRLQPGNVIQPFTLYLVRLLFAEKSESKWQSLRKVSVVTLGPN